MRRIVREFATVVALFLALAGIVAPSHCLKLVPEAASHCLPGQTVPLDHEQGTAGIPCAVCQGQVQAILPGPATLPATLVLPRSPHALRLAAEAPTLARATFFDATGPPALS